MKTQTEIDEEVAKLEAQLKTVRSHTLFGDSNIDAINAQIRVLREGLDEDGVYNLEDEGEFDEREVDCAREAIYWRDEDDDSPSSGWEPLCSQS